MILVGYWHGLRASEVVGLTADAIQDGYITVQRLKGSERTTQELIGHADPLLDERRALIDYTRGMAGNQKVFPVHRSTFWRMVKRHAKTAGIPLIRITTHSLKHSIARHTIENNGVDLVKKILGHKSLASTGKYLERTDEEASRALREHSKRLIV